jgi:hypothetical protein
MSTTQDGWEKGCDDLGERETVLTRLRDELRFESERLESLQEAIRDAYAYRRAARRSMVSPAYLVGLVISLPLLYLVTLICMAVTR